ncbi:TlpA disulfide reductase family protein [Acidovorax sp. MR-S7]|uniref:TlpA disulfide reductase family protein n=1 Tax=Acidovorax sp. MR-S7 TaxID=1268622 RepID=UPI000372D985|nr:TlpA disulfide reductase family protein [Acidovorax sp. MR-S7]GAD24654.1 thiol-disulfide isomerase and thioredoxins [Acidovorax sp. MR-S7]
MIGIGPYSFSVIAVLAAVIVAWIVARVFARRRPDITPKAVDGLILDAVLWGAVAARLGYIAQWWDEYAAAPLSMLSIGDGGFTWWIGVLAALALILWKTRAARAQRAPVLAGATVGVLIWLAAGSTLTLMQRSAPPLPALELSTLDERPITLNAAYAGRPVVLNLWASWCPPCRREMPVLHQAQTEFPDVAFVMVNQGERAQQARTFLEREDLTFKDVLVDPSSKAMQTLGTRGLPTTLFFDDQGRLVDTHLGELTKASLKHTLLRNVLSSHRTNTDTE